MMQIKKGTVSYQGSNDWECLYGEVELDGKLVQYYFMDNGNLPNGNFIASTHLVEAIDREVQTQNVGMIDSEGNVILPFEHKTIKVIPGDILLVEKNKPTSNSVLEAIELKKDPLSATKLVSTPAAIKEKMNAQMGVEGRYLFNDQFSEASIFDFDGKNLINDEYFSFIGIANNKLFFTKNVADAPITEYSVFPAEVRDENTVTDEAIDIQAVADNQEQIEETIEKEVENKEQEFAQELVGTEEVTPEVSEENVEVNNEVNNIDNVENTETQEVEGVVSDEVAEVGTEEHTDEVSVEGAVNEEVPAEVVNEEVAAEVVAPEENTIEAEEVENTIETNTESVVMPEVQIEKEVQEEQVDITGDVNEADPMEINEVETEVNMEVPVETSEVVGEINVEAPVIPLISANADSEEVNSEETEEKEEVSETEENVEENTEDVVNEEVSLNTDSVENVDDFNLEAGNDTGNIMDKVVVSLSELIEDNRKKQEVIENQDVKNRSLLDEIKYLKTNLEEKEKRLSDTEKELAILRAQTKANGKLLKLLDDANTLLGKDHYTATDNEGNYTNSKAA